VEATPQPYAGSSRVRRSYTAYGSDDPAALRVAAYTSLTTDAYPPFRLDTGGADPAEPLIVPTR